jgi:hypothetical protein
VIWLMSSAARNVGTRIRPVALVATAVLILARPAGDRGGPVGIVAGYNQHRVLIVPACRQQFRPQIFGNFGLVIA